MSFNTFNISGSKVLFIHIPKTAGTSILSCLNKSGDPKIKHLLLKNYHDKILENCFVFSVIRNPFDRFVSQWLYHTNFDDNFFYKKYKRKMDIVSYFDIASQLKDKAVTWKSMSEFIFNKNKKIDLILRFETLRNDWDNFCKKLNYNCELINYKKNTRKHYSEYYNPRLISKVEEMYIDDLTNFNYKFEKEVL
jgi:hypothetical protein